jgi:hypothetical protein
MRLLYKASDETQNAIIFACLHSSRNEIFRRKEIGEILMLEALCVITETKIKGKTG